MYAKLFFPLIVFLFSLSAEAQDNSLIQKLIHQGRVIKAVQQWNAAEEELLCVYSSSDELIGGYSTLCFYQKENLDYKEIFRYESYSHIVGMFQDRDYKGNLIVMWIGGSAYTFTVFSYANDKVQKVLESGSAMLPEFIYKDSEYSILVTNETGKAEQKTEESGSASDTTTVYKRNGNRYDKIIVPYKSRFDTEMKEK